MNDQLVVASTINLVPIEIWTPKYSTDECLIAVKKVKPRQHYMVWFSKAKHLEGKKFYIRAETIKKYPRSTNGSIPVYCVPMSELKLFKKERVW